MSADLLDSLLAGHVVPVRPALATPTPAKAANSANRRESRGLVADCTPCEALRSSAKTGPVSAGEPQDSQTFADFRKPPDRPLSQQTRGFSQDSQNSPGYPAACTTGDDVAAVAWTESDIKRFLDRRARLMRWGWKEADAEALAERLTLRDREGDGRRLCVECRHFRSGRCREAERAGIGGPEAGALALLLQRCPAFDPIESGGDQ